MAAEATLPSATVQNSTSSVYSSQQSLESRKAPRRTSLKKEVRSDPPEGSGVAQLEHCASAPLVHCERTRAKGGGESCVGGGAFGFEHFDGVVGVC